MAIMKNKPEEIKIIVTEDEDGALSKAIENVINSDLERVKNVPKNG